MNDLNRSSSASCHSIVRACISFASCEVVCNQQTIFVQFTTQTVASNIISTYPMVTKNERTLYISMSKRDNKNRDFDWFPITNSEDKNERDNEFSILMKHIIHILYFIQN